MSHEDLTREQPLEASSDRSFGLVFAAVFLLIAGWPLFHGEVPRWWAAGIAGLFGLGVAWVMATFPDAPGQVVEGTVLFVVLTLWVPIAVRTWPRYRRSAGVFPPARLPSPRTQ